MSTVLGMYRNPLGAEIEITGYANEGRRDILGTVYVGVAKDSLFGDRPVLVTPEFLAENYSKEPTK